MPATGWWLPVAMCLFVYAGASQFAALALIIVAAILDALDGRLARLLKSESEIGAELDSLCDFVNFGVAPGFVLYLWSLQALGGFGYVPCLMFAVCMALLGTGVLARNDFDLFYLLKQWRRRRRLRAAAEQRGGLAAPSPALATARRPPALPPMAALRPAR